MILAFGSWGFGWDEGHQPTDSTDILAMSISLAMIWPDTSYNCVKFLLALPGKHAKY